MKTFQKILVATDFSPHAERALEEAIAWAKAFAAEVVVLHAYDLPLHFVSPYEVSVPDPYFQQTRAAAAEQLEEAAARVRAAGSSVDTILSEVPAARAIAEAAERIGADLVVVGTRGRTGLPHVLLGSVAERTVRLAPCPVLTVGARP